MRVCPGCGAAIVYKVSLLGETKVCEVGTVSVVTESGRVVTGHPVHACGMSSSGYNDGAGNNRKAEGRWETSE